MTLATNGSRQALPATLPTTPDWIQHHPNPAVRDVLSVLGHLLTGTRPTPQENGNVFAERILGVSPDSPLTAEQAPLTLITRITFGLTLADWIAEHSAAIGPYGPPAPPAWTLEPFGDDTKLRLPHRLSAGFPAGTLADAPAVIRYTGRGGFDGMEIEVVVRPADQLVALEILDAIRTAAAARNPYRGRWLRVTMSAGGKLGLIVETAPAVTREAVVADETVWEELDLAVKAVTTDHPTTLGGRRGVLLAGPPGVGKSAVCTAVAGTLHRDAGFTVLVADPKVGEAALTHVVRQAAELAPACLILEDLDLWIPPDRRAGGRGLAELLAGMDSGGDKRILILATTNSVRLDPAAVRRGRFDAILTVGYPDRATVEKLLAIFLRSIPDADVDVAAVAAMIPRETSGADVREIVRRAVLAGLSVSTLSMTAVIKGGRWRPEAPRSSGPGHYL